MHLIFVSGLWVRRSSVAVVAVLLMPQILPATAAGAKNVYDFRLSGTATLRENQPAQQSGPIQLRAVLSPNDRASQTSRIVQEASGFALIAKLTVASQVCYNDTIFRDDFDGDGG